MRCRVIGVMSFKGGVGKTVSAINLATGLSLKGKKVLVIDGNFLSPTLHFYLGLLRPKTTLKEVIRNNLAPENAIYEHKSGIHLLPCNFYKGIDLNKLKKIVDELKEKYDYIIVDSGPSYTDEIIAILMISDELIFITTADYPTLASTVKAAKFAKYKNVKILGIVVNRKRNKKYELSKKDIEATVKLPVICTILEDHKMMSSVLEFVPVVWKYRRSKSAKAYLELADKVCKSDNSWSLIGSSLR
ncbi:AAA family ATPase [Candidatus Pacearchaeota archaeon]|nr:AAA family ATPase [Candidatus Pacearchaeota archaeon]